jgi:hypothetical protein
MSLDCIRDYLIYDPATGLFAWLKTPNAARPEHTGARAGCVAPIGYVQIRFRRKLYYGHRLAWFFVHGKMPPHEIDHINGDRSDNRIANLRPATHRENCKNMSRMTGQRLNTSGLKGVFWDKRRKRWRASITADSRTHFVGRFDTREEAARAYDAAAIQRHGQFAKLNFPAA